MEFFYISPVRKQCLIKQEKVLCAFKRFIKFMGDVYMKKILLFAVLFTLLTICLLNLPAITQTPTETSVTGTLHLGYIPIPPPQPPGSIEQSHPPNQTGYWLKLDKPIYVLEGSKSEASTDIVVLRVQERLLKKTKKLDGRHVIVTGQMHCTGNWNVGAQCNMLVKQIENVE